MRLRLAGSLALLLAAGCGNDDAAEETGGTDGGRDASLGVADAGDRVDASGPALDGGSPVDGSVNADAGSGPTGPLTAYVGGYSGAIGRYTVDETSGALSFAASTPSFGTRPSFLAITRASTFLYAVDESDTGKVGAYSVAAGTGALAFLGAVSSGGSGPAYVGLDRSDSFVLVANYTSGTTAVLPIQPDGTLGAPTDTRAPGELAHMMIADPTNHFVFVPCKGSDYVAQFVFDASTGTLAVNPKAATLPTAKGAGPRHLAFHPDGKHVYLINETASTLQELTLDPVDGTLTAVQTISSLGPASDGADAGGNTAAEIWVHPSGAWLFASNRGDDSLVVFALDPTSGAMSFKSRVHSGGASPRDFTVAPSPGAFVYAANQVGGDVVPFGFDASTGALSPLAGAEIHDAGAISVSMPSFVALVRLRAE